MNIKKQDAGCCKKDEVISGNGEKSRRQNGALNV
jgi:hypothetical protein